jgi:hypothetical protein
MTLRPGITRSSRFAWYIAAIPAIIAAIAVATPQAGAQNPEGKPELTLTATTANVENRTVTIDILRWSTDEERNKLITALNTPAKPPAATAAAPATAQPAAAAAGAQGATPAPTR